MTLPFKVSVCPAVGCEIVQVVTVAPEPRVSEMARSVVPPESPEKANVAFGKVVCWPRLIVVPAPIADGRPALAMEFASMVPVAMFRAPVKAFAAFVRNSVPASVCETRPVTLEFVMRPDCMMLPAPRKMRFEEPPVMPPVRMRSPKPLLLIVAASTALVRLITRFDVEPSPV